MTLSNDGTTIEEQAKETYLLRQEEMWHDEEKL
jgi:hypothetical protein